MGSCHLTWETRMVFWAPDFGRDHLRRESKDERSTSTPEMSQFPNTFRGTKGEDLSVASELYHFRPYVTLELKTGSKNRE